MTMLVYRLEHGHLELPRDGVRRHVQLHELCRRFVQHGLDGAAVARHEEAGADGGLGSVTKRTFQSATCRRVKTP